MIDYTYGAKVFFSNNFSDKNTIKNIFNSNFLTFFQLYKYQTLGKPQKTFSIELFNEISTIVYDSYGADFSSLEGELISFTEVGEKSLKMSIFFQENARYSLSNNALASTLRDGIGIFLAKYSFQEYDFKHKEIQDHGEGMTSEGWLGTSLVEFRKYLSGIYSFTLFGHEIIEFFSRAKLESMKTVFPNLEYFEGEHYFGFQIDDENQSLETVIQIQKQIAQYLGQEYFFDRDLVGQVEFKPIPTILEKIR